LIQGQAATTLTDERDGFQPSRFVPAMLDTAPIRVLLFARYADLLGLTEVELPLPDPATVGGVVAEMRLRPGGAGLPPTLLVAVNARQASLDSAVRPGDEVALLPPMAGG